MTPKTLLASLIEESSAERDLSSSEGFGSLPGRGVGSTGVSPAVLGDGSGVAAESEVANKGDTVGAGFEAGCCVGDNGCPADVSTLVTPASAISDTADCDGDEPSVLADAEITEVEEGTEGTDTLNCAGDDTESADETAGQTDGALFKSAGGSGCKWR